MWSQSCAVLHAVAGKHSRPALQCSAHCCLSISPWLYAENLIDTLCDDQQLHCKSDQTDFAALQLRHPASDCPLKDALGCPTHNRLQPDLTCGTNIATDPSRQSQHQRIICSMDQAPGKSKRRLTKGSASSVAAAWHQREQQAAMADFWPPSRIPAPPPNDPPRAPPNSLATSVWSREASTIGGRSSVSGLPWSPGALRDHLQPGTAENEADGSISAHTAQPLEDDWVPSYQRPKGRPSAAWPSDRRATATGRPAEELPPAKSAGRASGGHQNSSRQMSGRQPGNPAATVISWPHSTPNANAITTLADVSAGSPPQPVTADRRPSDRRQSEQRHQQRHSRLLAFPPPEASSRMSALERQASGTTASSRLPADSLIGRQNFLDSIGSSTASPPDRCNLVLF